MCVCACVYNQVTHSLYLSLEICPIRAELHILRGDRSPHMGNLLNKDGTSFPVEQLVSVCDYCED